MNDSRLHGCGVLVTRPSHQAESLVTAIEHAGGNAFRFPVIDIVGRDVADVGRDLAAADSPDILVFVSANAVTHGLSAIDRFKTNSDRSNADSPKIAAIGPATVATLKSAGLDADIFPTEGFDSEHLLQHPALQTVSGQKIVIVRGQDGRELLAETLTARGAAVSYLSVYERQVHQATTEDIARLGDAWRKQRIHYVTTMSVHTLTGLIQLLPDECLKYLAQSTLVAPSARVLQTASNLLPGITTALAPGPQAEEMTQALTELWISGQNQ